MSRTPRKGFAHLNGEAARNLLKGCWLLVASTCGVAMERVAARIYENIFGLLLPILFLLSLFMTYHAGMTLLSRYQGKAHRKGTSVATSDLGLAHPERSFFHNNERFDVLAVYDGRTSAGREVMVRQSSTGQVKTYRIGDRLISNGPFVAAIEKDRVYFWMDGRTKKIPLTP